MKKIMVSVITPVYNNEKYISQCIESILGQTYGDFEYIIVDDGSTDSTLSLAQSYAAKDERIKIVENGKNYGQAYSMNAGVKSSIGDFIVVMDSDDVAMPQRIARQLTFLENNKDYGICGALQIIVDEKDKEISIKEAEQKSGDITQFVHDTAHLSHSTCMFRKQVFQDVGGYRAEFRRAQDYDLFLRISEKNKIYNIPEVLLAHRFSIERATISDRRTQLLFTEVARRLASQRKTEGADILQKGDVAAFTKLKREVFGCSCLPKNFQVSSNYLYWAHRMYHRGPLSYAKELIKRSVMNNPLNIKAWLYMAFLFLDDKSRKKLENLKHGFWNE
ncbi:MAG: glycosyltransferase [Candidatus Omnitrophica bacterium]|nr:glycosyltransferase [Candidatus Omnitrophota bacterium]